MLLLDLPLYLLVGILLPHEQTVNVGVIKAIVKRCLRIFLLVSR